MKPTDQSRREFVRKVAYVAPAIVTLAVLPAHQAVGSVRQDKKDKKDKKGDIQEQY